MPLCCRASATQAPALHAARCNIYDQYDTNPNPNPTLTARCNIYDQYDTATAVPFLAGFAAFTSTSQVGVYDQVVTYGYHPTTLWQLQTPSGYRRSQHSAPPGSLSHTCMHLLHVHASPTRGCISYTWISYTCISYTCMHSGHRWVRALIYDCVAQMSPLRRPLYSLTHSRAHALTHARTHTRTDGRTD